MSRNSTKNATRSAVKSTVKTAKSKAASVTKVKAGVKVKAKPAKPKKNVINQSPTAEQISIRAYEIWLRKGRPIGQDEANWLEAEAELKVAP